MYWTHEHQKAYQEELLRKAERERLKREVLEAKRDKDAHQRPRRRR